MFTRLRKMYAWFGGLLECYPDRIGPAVPNVVSYPDIKVFAAENKRGEFDHFRVKIGDWEDKVPLRFLLKSELSKLEALLKRAQATK